MIYNGKNIGKIIHNNKNIQKIIYNGKIIYQLNTSKGIIYIDTNESWEYTTAVSSPDTNYAIYRSFSNYNVHNSIARMRLYWTGYTEFSFKYRSYAEGSYDYICIGSINNDLSGLTSVAYNTSGIQYNTRGNQSSSVWQTATYSELDVKETYFVDIFYRKDSSANSGDDRGYISFEIPNSYTELNDQWQISSKTLNGYNVYESFSNYNVNSEIARMRLYWTGYTEFSFKYRSYAESSFDYVCIGSINNDLSGLTSVSDTTSGIQYDTKGNQSSSVWQTATYSGLNTSQIYFVDIFYRKDGSQHSNDDKGYIAIEK